MVKIYGSTRTPQEEMPLVVVKYNPNKSEEYPPELEKLLFLQIKFFKLRPEVKTFQKFS